MTLNEKHDADRACRQFDHRHSDLVSGYTPYVEDNSDDSKVVAPVNTDAEFSPDAKAVTDNSLKNFPHRLPLMTDT